MNRIRPKVALSDDIFDCLDKLPRGSYHKAYNFILRFRNNPESPGINFERIKAAKDKNMRSVRIDDNLRGIVLAPEKESVYVLLWIGNHDDAYEWAKNRIARVNPVLGSLQVFSVDEHEEVAKPDSKEKEAGLFEKISDSDIFKLGVPEELLSLVRDVKSEGGLEQIESILPPEAYDGLYLIAAGYSFDEALEQLERKTEKTVENESDFSTALDVDESKRNYWVSDNEQELLSMLDAPLEKWRVFLHPSQRKLVERDWNGPVRVLGGAGTGKTVTAIHRARWLAEHRFNGYSDRILFTTYSTNLATDIQQNLNAICNKELLQKIEVINLDAWVYASLKSQGDSRKLVFPDMKELETIWTETVNEFGKALEFNTRFFQEEWKMIIQNQGINSLEKYLAAKRTGRGTALNRSKKTKIWKVFEGFRARLDEEGLMEPDDAYRHAGEILRNKPQLNRYKAVIVDEAQDMGAEAFRLIHTMVHPESDPTPKNNLFIVGDGHQGIYGRKVVLGQCNINIRGRSRKLRINYRTSEEISKWAFKVLEGVDVDDLDDGKDDGRGYRSLFRGMEPEIVTARNQDEEVKKILDWINQLQEEEIALSDICIIARTNPILDKIKKQLQDKGYSTFEIKRRKADDRRISGIRLATMHRAKGLEFVAVALASINNDLVPINLSLANLDEAGKEEVLNSDRMLVYVASTRAKKRLLVSSSGTMTEIVKRSL